ncbi:MAG: two-component system, cell cycle response regulator [Solirubrobacterales bacterium]|jgi:diguanylate cyclase (GGDEF)-like protein|nr:two-component system, cell cycle response regulator [Solirubrobacterales bacterium]
MLDMDERVAPVRALTLGMLALIALAQAHWLGLWTLVPLVVAAAGFAAGARLSSRTDRPEYVLFASWILSEVVIAATVLIAGLDSSLLSWLAIPVITLSARFSTHGVIAGVGVALALCVGVAFAADAGAVLAFPPILFGPAAVIVAVGVLSTALMRSDFEHRDEAVIDQLTGMLNRHALTRRAVELEQQSKLTGEPIGIVLGDLDHFKHVNDALGHAVGDAVLADVAYTIRKQLRAFDLAYRLGGEEFLILVPGSDPARTADLAEELRAAIASQRFADREVTMTFGVSATEAGQTFDYTAHFERADTALYAAKRGGRNLVGSAPTP